MTGPEQAPRKRAAFESPARLLAPLRHDPAMRRPATTTAGAALVLLRVVAGVLVLAGIAFEWTGIVADAAEVAGADVPRADATQGALWAVLIVGGAVLLAELAVAVFVWLGANWARVVVMLFAVVSISATFAGWWARDEELTVRATLLAIGLDVLILLALSSRSAAAYARRNERA